MNGLYLKHKYDDDFYFDPPPSNWKPPFLASTFSPMMLTGFTIDNDGEIEALTATVREIDFDEMGKVLAYGFDSVVSHEVTAEILTGVIGMPVDFNRVNVSLVSGDIMICIVPKFRADVAREFTRDEINGSFRIFKVTIK